MVLETHILDLIEGRKSSPVAKALLGAMSQCYRAGVSLRHFAYDWIIPIAQLQIPVISVGNIVAGGSGKTPFVEYLAKALAPKKVAILSRGYRRKSRKTVVVKEWTSPEECGDEPYLLAQKVPEATVIVDADRAFAGLLAQILDADLVLLDDGMQHRKLNRDIEIAVMHADDLFGKAHFLPRGLLRDSPKRLKNAHHIILGGVRDEEHFSKLEKLIRHYSNAPITAMELFVENSTKLASKKVVAFSAIANPKRFHNTLKSLGCDIILSEEKPDHTAFTEEEIQRLANLAKGAECLVCTEKDAVKLPKNLHLHLPVIPVRISLTPTFGKEHLEKRIQEVKDE